MQQNLFLDEVKSHFDHWRATRPKRAKIPSYLWDKVKSLIGHYSLTIITKTLSINTNQIKDNLTLSTEMNFVEASVLPTLVNPPTASLANNTQTYSIEFHRANGGILKISALPATSLATIIAQFME
jgi:hypothetical protein